MKLEFQDCLALATKPLALWFDLQIIPCLVIIGAIKRHASSCWSNNLSEETSSDQQFSHKIEAEFARILDYYGIEWQYEPRTFPLAWDELGNVTKAFSPDFYLSAQDLYVELTTLRPKLIRHKNRKIRQLKELYPEINIKLFKRDDLRNLMIKFGLDTHATPIFGTEAQDQSL
jgi:hypoxanthine phosphoribosyltransferase